MISKQRYSFVELDSKNLDLYPTGRQLPLGRNKWSRWCFRWWSPFLFQRSCKAWAIFLGYGIFGQRTQAHNCQSIVNHGYRCLFKYPGQQRPELIQYRRIGLDYIHLRYYVRILDIRWKSWCIWEHRWKTQLEPAAQEASLWRLCSHLFASTISSPGCAGSETFSWSQQEMLEIGFKWWNMWRLWLCCFGHRKLQWEVYSWSLGDAEFYGPHPS